MLNFLNLKSFPPYLFFVVASSLCILWIVLVLLFLMQTPLNVIKYYAITCSWYHVIKSIVTSLHILFLSTSNMVFTWKIHQDYLPHNALEQNIWYFLLQRNGFNACKINRIYVFSEATLCALTSKHECRGTGDCCMACTIHTHEAKVCCKYYRACLTYGLLYVTHTHILVCPDARSLWATTATKGNSCDQHWSIWHKILPSY